VSLFANKQQKNGTSSRVQKHASASRLTSCLVPAFFPQQTMSSNLELQEDTSSSPVENRAKMIENFVKDLVVDRDFKLDDNGDIIMIRQLSIAKCTVPLLRRICVRFKVSGYKNQNKETTVGLLKNLVQRDSLKNNMYNDDEDSVSTYISGSSQERARDKDTQPGTGRDKYEGEEEGEEELSLDGDENEERSSSIKRSSKMIRSERVSAVATKKRKKKRAKGTPPDAVTCVNTFYRIINVLMCQRNVAVITSKSSLSKSNNLQKAAKDIRYVLLNACS
jgi:hypothetical protein